MSATATDKTLVSVVIPAYNAAWCLGRALDSVLAQTWPALEILVVDDGSSDATPAVLERYGSRIRVIRQANAGMSAARNSGIAAARGALLAFLDADDWWRPEKVARQVSVLQARPEVGFCSTTAELSGPEGQRLGQWVCEHEAHELVEALLAGSAPIAGGASSVMVRREVLKRAGPFDPAMRGAEDPDLWIRLAALSPYAWLREPLTVVTRNPASVSRDREAMRAGALRLLAKHRGLLRGSDSARRWRRCYASVLMDYAKWEYRDGLRARALRHLGEALLRAPLDRGRPALGLMLAVSRGQRL